MLLKTTRSAWPCAQGHSIPLPRFALKVVGGLFALRMAFVRTKARALVGMTKKPLQLPTLVCPAPAPAPTSAILAWPQPLFPPNTLRPKAKVTLVSEAGEPPVRALLQLPGHPYHRYMASFATESTDYRANLTHIGGAQVVAMHLDRLLGFHRVPTTSIRCVCSSFLQHPCPPITHILSLKPAAVPQTPQD